MRTPRHAILLLVTMAALLAGCGDTAKLRVSAGTSPSPVLPTPDPPLIATVNVAPATGWPPGAAPAPAPGLKVTLFAAGLDHPRWLYVLPNGDVLVAETNAPPRPQDNQGIRGWIAGLMMKRAGAGVASANRITLLRGLDAHGAAMSRSAPQSERKLPVTLRYVAVGLSSRSLPLLSAAISG